MRPLRIAVLTSTFPPLGGVGMRRKAKLAKYLARQGVEVHFITTRNVAQPNSYLDDVSGHGIHVATTVSLSLTNLMRSQNTALLARVGRRVIFTLLSPLYFIDTATLWGLMCVPFTERYLRERQIRYLYCSGGPFSDLWHASRVKQRMGDEVTLVAEWRDVWTEDPYRSYPWPRSYFKRLNQRIERHVLQRCDKVLAVTRTLAGIQAEKLGDADKVGVIENGVDPEDFIGAPSDRSDTRITIAYSGDIGGTRRDCLSVVLDAIECLDQRGVGVRLRIAGTIQRGHAVSARLAEMEAAGLVETLGLLSPGRAHAVVESADYALLLAQPELAYAIPSKFYDYVGARRTVIGVGPRGELMTAVHSGGLGCFVEYGAEGASEALCSYVESRNQAPSTAFDALIQHNSFERLSTQLVEVFTSLDEAGG